MDKRGHKERYDQGLKTRREVLGAQVIAIGSAGRGTTGLTSLGLYTIGPFTPTNYVQDIVWADGYFVRWPGGLQSN